jgi:hypothetical protein
VERERIILITNVPISKYFKGSGSKVMKSMKKKYGEKKGKQIFYATSNKRKRINTGPKEK